MNATHTPAPWNAANTGNHQGLVISEANGANVATTYDKADAALVAAAPDLLSALKSLVSDFEDVLPTLRSAGWQTHNEQATLRRAYTAIQKAEGE